MGNFKNQFTWEGIAGQCLQRDSVCFSLLRFQHHGLPALMYPHEIVWKQKQAGGQTMGSLCCTRRSRCGTLNALRRHREVRKNQVGLSYHCCTLPEQEVSKSPEPMKSDRTAGSPLTDNLHKHRFAECRFLDCA